MFLEKKNGFTKAVELFAAFTEGSTAIFDLVNVPARLTPVLNQGNICEFKLILPV
jgi:hypothetical protein